MAQVALEKKNDKSADEVCENVVMGSGMTHLHLYAKTWEYREQPCTSTINRRFGHCGKGPFSLVGTISCHVCHTVGLCPTAYST